MSSLSGEQHFVGAKDLRPLLRSPTPMCISQSLLLNDDR
jgi:hypothetical protein